MADKARQRRKSKTEAPSNEPESKASASSDSFWGKALTPNAGWDKESFPDFYDAVYWVRQIISLILGIAWGILPMTGAIGFIGFGACNAALTFLYYSKYAKVDEDDFGHTELFTEGAQASLGIFVTAWIVTFTYLHGEPQPVVPV